MNITLSDATAKLLHHQMEQSNMTDPDEVVRLALESLEGSPGVGYEELDPDTRREIEQAEAEYRRGEGIPWEEAKERLLRQFHLKS